MNLLRQFNYLVVTIALGVIFSSELSFAETSRHCQDFSDSTRQCSYPLTNVTIISYAQDPNQTDAPKGYSVITPDCMILSVLADKISPDQKTPLDNQAEQHLKTDDMPSQVGIQLRFPVSGPLSDPTGPVTEINFVRISNLPPLRDKDRSADVKARYKQITINEDSRVLSPVLVPSSESKDHASVVAVLRGKQTNSNELPQNRAAEVRNALAYAINVAQILDTNYELVVNRCAERTRDKLRYLPKLGSFFLQKKEVEQPQNPSEPEKEPASDGPIPTEDVIAQSVIR